MFTLIPQRFEGDCGIASLAMLLRVPYEDAFVACQGVARKARKQGMTFFQLRQAAKQLGADLVLRRSKYDPDLDEGVLGINYGPNEVGHFVYLNGGVIYDPSGSVIAEVEEYLEKAEATSDGLLMLR